MSARLGPVEDRTRSDDQRELRRRFAEGRRVATATDFTLLDDGGDLTGPPAAWLLAPALGLALESLGHAIRFELSLPRRMHEIVILSVARAEDNEFERWAHIRAGRAAGLTETEIAALLDGTARFDDPAEQRALDLADGLLAGGAIPDGDFDGAVADLGRPAVFEVVTLVGYYRMMALQLRTFDVRPPTT